MKGIVILGQTATGKSDFAVEIAKKVGGEIISADSRQVYKGMDLGTGKIIKKEMRGVPHHLLDVATPSKVFSVRDFQKLANKKIKDILKRGKVPIICGGTGFYIDAIVNGTIFPEVKPNKKLRKELEKKTTEKLFETLKKLDIIRAETIDKHNKVRIIRAIEIAMALGFVPSLPSSLQVSDTCMFIKIGLVMPNEILKERIYARLISRLKQGMMKEMKKLHENGVSWRRMENLGLEYRYCALYLQNKLSIEEMVGQLNSKIWQFAKRQKTWFQRDKSIIWINPLKKAEKTKAIKKVKEFLK